MQQNNLFQIGSNNVFSDLAMKNPEEILEKAALVSKIIESVDVQGLTPGKACQVLDIDLEQLYVLRKGKLNAFSLTQLTNCLTALQTKV